MKLLILSTVFLGIGIILIRLSIKIKRNKIYVSPVQTLINQKKVEFDNYKLFSGIYLLSGIVLLIVSLLSIMMYLFISIVSA